MNTLIPPRRRFLSDMGTGFASLALGAMLQRDGFGAKSDWIPPDGLTHFAPKAKSVIWLFMAGGVSQVETFDPKPELTKHGGKTIPNTPFASVLESPYIKNRIELVKGDANGKIYDKLYPLQVGYRKRGESGIEVSDWLPQLSECVDDLAIVRSMWTTASNHDAQLQFHTGRNRFDGFFPTIGAWVHYGLGSLNDSLPQFIVMGNKIGDCCGGKGTEGADYLGPEHDGVTLSVDPKNPLPFAIPAAGAGLGRADESTAIARSAQPTYGERVPARYSIGGAHQVVRAGVPNADGGSRCREPGGRDGGNAPALRDDRRSDKVVRPTLSDSSTTGRTRRAVRADLPRRWWSGSPGTLTVTSRQITRRTASRPINPSQVF